MRAAGGSVRVISACDSVPWLQALRRESSTPMFVAILHEVPVEYGGTVPDAAMHLTFVKFGYTMEG